MSLTPYRGFIEIGKESGVKPHCNRLNTLRLHIHTYLLNTNFSQFRNIFLQSLSLLLRFNLLLQFRVSSPGLLFAVYWFLFPEWFYLFCILKGMYILLQFYQVLCKSLSEPALSIWVFNITLSGLASQKVFVYHSINVKFVVYT